MVFKMFGFCDISTIVGYSMPYPFYTYILNYLTLLTCKTELFEIELFDHLTVRKQMGNV